KKVNGGTCGVDNDCASDWCGPGSVCKGKLIVGADCSFGNRCASGWCIDFKCVAAGGQPTKVQATVGPTRRLTAMPTQPVEGCTAVQASGSAKKCDGNTAMTCTKLANGSTIWKSTVCTYGCSGGKCNPAPTPGPIVLQPNDNKCACINGKIVNDGACQYLVGSACKYVTPIVLQPNDNKCACINGKIVNDGGCQYVIGSACKYVTPTVVAPTGACINGAHVVQASLLNCDPGTKRTCDCDNRQWSCFCDTNDDGDKTCIDSAKGNKLSNGTWAHLDDESSAKCICGGGNYHLNSNGKYVCGNSGGGNGGGQATVTPPRGGGGGACNSSSPKPADICVAKMLSIKPVCNNGEWDYEQQLCTAKGRTEVCGGKKYCCPSAGGAWTTNMTSCPNAPSGTTGSCKQCPSDFKCYRRGSEFKWFVSGYVMDGFALYIPENVKEPCGGVPKPAFRGKNKGDANCDGKIDVTDYSLWHKEFFDGNKGAVVKNSWHADFTGPNGKCDSKVDVYDFSLWQKFFNEFTKPD
ncbi:hypothetical protein HYV64_05290, partial [Candidatus Shapirobacteria bacterium]|nr:hypothetical protein [Candidatus Shapirobacteria bacterium]